MNQNMTKGVQPEKKSQSILGMIASSREQAPEGREGKGDGAIAATRDREARAKKDDTFGINLAAKIPVLGAPFRAVRDDAREKAMKNEQHREQNEAMSRSQIREMQDRSASIYQEGGDRRATEKSKGLDMA